MLGDRSVVIRWCNMGNTLETKKMKSYEIPNFLSKQVINTQLIRNKLTIVLNRLLAITWSYATLMSRIMSKLTRQL